MRSLIINYGVGNLYSISSSLARVGFEVEISSIPKDDYDLVVFPGVGSFPAVSRYVLKYRELIEDIRRSGVAFLGICIGMHILFEYGLEGGVNRGLGWFKGYIDKISTSNKLPHIGWDKVYLHSKSRSCSIGSILDNEYVYFIHSYIAYPSEDDIICLVSNYGTIFPAMVARERVLGTQFHPEKSGKTGLRFLESIYRWLKC